MTGLGVFFVHHLKKLLRQVLKRIFSSQQMETVISELFVVLEELAKRKYRNNQLHGKFHATQLYGDEIEISISESSDASSSHFVVLKNNHIFWFNVRNKYHESILRITRIAIFAVFQGIIEASLINDMQFLLPEIKSSSWADMDTNSVMKSLEPFFNAFGYQTTDEIDLEHLSPLQSTDRFKRLIHLLEMMIVSVSPFVKYPPPHLLKRMQNDEQARKHARKISGGSVSSLQSVLKHAKNDQARLSNWFVMEQTSDDDERYVISLQDRSCVKSLVDLNDGIDGVISDQKLSCLFTFYPGSELENSFEERRIVRPPCVVNHLDMKFYDPNSDLSLGEFLNDLVKNAEGCCIGYEEQCSLMRWEHELNFYSGQQGRIRVHMWRNSEDINDKVKVVTRCTLCDGCTPKSELSSLSLGYSFAKFLEQLIYNPLFTPHTVPICRGNLERWCDATPSPNRKLWPFTKKQTQNPLFKQFTSGASPFHRTSLIHEFHHSNYSISFQFVPIRLFDILLPSRNLQADALVRTAKLAADGLGVLITPSTGLKPLKQMVDSYWSGVNAYFDLLNDLTHDNGAAELKEFILLLQKEQESMNKWLESESEDVEPILLRYNNSKVKNDSKLSSMIWYRLRNLRRDLYNKIIALDREVSHFIHAIDSANIPPYEASIHPDSLWRRIHPVTIDESNPASIVVFALSSREVRELTGLLEEQDIEGGCTPIPTTSIDNAILVNNNIEFKHSNHKLLLHNPYMYHKLRNSLSLELNDFIHSITSTVKYRPSHGKSSASFYKTTDDRFIIKITTRKQPPLSVDYINHITNNASLLVKILCEISIDNSKVLIMENLFYGKRISSCLDLKGLASTTLNLNNIILHSHAHTLLFNTLNEDLSILADKIDYSLLVGIYNDYLIVGIIDYIEEYDIWRRIECKSKSVMMNDVTIQPPMRYKTRFMNAMRRYFGKVPDRYTNSSQ